MLKTVFVPGAPVAKQRPRHYVKDGRSIVYTPAKTHAAEQHIRDRWTQMHGIQPAEGPICLTVGFFMPIPKSRQRHTRHGDPHIIKPDADNLLKTVQDALNGIAYNDDAQIAETTTYKQYSDIPGILITIDALK